MTNGRDSGTSGLRLGRRGWLATGGLIALIVFVNVTTQLDDARRRGVTVPVSLPLTLEITSVVAALTASIVVVAAMALAPPERRPLWRTVAIHMGGSLVYSGAHVALMTVLRTFAFAAAGRPYPWTLAALPYEYRKDLLTYTLMAGAIWVLTRRRAAIGPADPKPAGPATFDIRDGASILRPPVHEILAARAAGNYVEFALQDGRRPLMRASLAQIEAALTPHGFLRTHRSWLVNAGRVRGLSAAGSGDFRLDLGCELSAPLSRRYPAALARLRGEA